MANDSTSVPDQDAAFKAWMKELRFAIEPAELDRVRAAFERLAVMNRLNRTSSSRRRRRRYGVGV
jgi:hypothetical protein